MALKAIFARFKGIALSHYIYILDLLVRTDTILFCWPGWDGRTLVRTPAQEVRGSEEVRLIIHPANISGGSLGVLGVSPL